jgi:hypothetical protein
VSHRGDRDHRVMRLLLCDLCGSRAMLFAINRSIDISEEVKKVDLRLYNAIFDCDVLHKYYFWVIAARR